MFEAMNAAAIEHAGEPCPTRVAIVEALIGGRRVQARATLG